MKPEGKNESMPASACWIIRRIFGDDSGARMGDFEEIYNEFVHKKGKTGAWWRIHFYLIKSVPHYLGDTVASWFAIVKQNLISAGRNLKQNKLTSLVNIIGLAIGIACFIVINLWIRDEKSFDRFHEKKDHLYLLTITHANGVIDYNVPYALAPLMADKFPEISRFTRIYEYSAIHSSFFKYDGEKNQKVMFNEDNVILVDKEFFSMFSFPFKYGNPETALERKNSLVITDKMALKYFGDANPIGKILNFNNRRDLEVTGVINVPSNSQLQMDFMIPLRSRLDQNWNWRDRSYVLLDEKTSVSGFMKKIENFMNDKAPFGKNLKFQVGIFPFTSVHLGFGRQIYVTIFSLIAILIVAIACINYTNLSIAHSLNRSREVGLKKVVGATRSQLIQQFLRESLLVFSVSFLISLLLVQIFLPVINNLTARQLTFPLQQNLPLIFYFFCLSIILGLATGLYPAIFLSRKKPVDILNTAFTRTAGRSTYQFISVVGQFAVSILLIISTAFVLKQLHFIRTRPLGISTDHIIKIPINPVLRRDFHNYKTILSQNMNIISVTAGQAVPFNEDYKTGGVRWDGMNPAATVNVRYSVSYADYHKTFGIEILAGRGFRDDISDANNYLINETAASYMNMENPVGQRLVFWKTEGIIIGVVKDYHHVPLHREIMPHIFTVNPKYANALKFVFVKIASGHVPETLNYIRKKTQMIAPEYPFSYAFLDREIDSMYHSEQKLAEILGYFTMLAILISCMGIYALIAFTIRKKVREIGIRKVLGSSVPGIVKLLSHTFFKWILLANLIAWPIGFLAMGRWLDNFAYRINLTLPVFVLATVLSLMVAAIPIVSQSVRAAFANPIDTIRYE